METSSIILIIIILVFILLSAKWNEIGDAFDRWDYQFTNWFNKLLHKRVTIDTGKAALFIGIGYLYTKSDDAMVSGNWLSVILIAVTIIVLFVYVNKLDTRREKEQSRFTPSKEDIINLTNAINELNRNNPKDTV